MAVLTSSTPLFTHLPSHPLPSYTGLKSVTPKKNYKYLKSNQTIKPVRNLWINDNKIENSFYCITISYMWLAIGGSFLFQAIRLLNYANKGQHSEMT